MYKRVKSKPVPLIHTVWSAGNPIILFPQLQNMFENKERKKKKEGKKWLQSKIFVDVLLSLVCLCLRKNERSISLQLASSGQ